ncbi:MAG TPA: UDP-N-acetylmuramoyl-tripeptide--D-alanyl-D-alanine ligase [Gammaproteobacteria bacterium]|nr:UDP-N-acetylmuramoyl-tripeptide--D-alanyl-D-alanine ligase [Gammaproteobacteria bacterium]
MMLSQLSHIVNGRCTGSDVAFDSVSIDTRTLCSGALFVALKGPNFDGHDFVSAARDRGANAAMISSQIDDYLPAVTVDDTRIALGELAASWRTGFDIPLLAVTGSNGKTTVKEMLNSIFVQACGGEKDRVLSTIGNLNNDLGLPLTLLRMRDRHRYAVTEMGMNNPGELSYLTRIARPDVAVITNAAAAHLQGLQSVEGVARAKAEIFSGVKTGGTAIINDDDDYAALWRELAGDLQIIGFSLQKESDVTAEFDLYKDHSRVFLKTPWGETSCKLALPGQHNIANALAATAAAGSVGISLSDIATGLEAWRGIDGRQQSKTINSLHVIDDTYNANPASIRAALEVLAMQPGRKIFVMGDMAELGEDSALLHKQAGELAGELGVDSCYTLGEQSVHAADAFARQAQSFSTPDELLVALTKELRANRGRPINILIKGSRAMKMERIIEQLDESVVRD